MQKPGGSVVPLTTNTYDVYDYGLVDAVSNPSTLRQHDTTNYGASFVHRGNVTRSVSPGKAVNMRYYYTGTAWRTTDDYGHQATQTPDSTKNYAVPSAMTAGSLSTSFSWNGYNALTSSTGPNGATSSFTYDAYAWPASKTAPNGAVTNFTYGATVPYWTLATTGTRWTKSTMDGFGRTIKVESGYNTGGTPTTVSTVDTMYAPCACTPVGKLWKTSLPYGPGGTVYWTEHLYDALGRTVQVKQPINPATSATWGTTTYQYTGIVVKTIDPAGKWKKYENDALGNLVKVTEPRPGGGTDYETTYTYSELGQLLTSTMSRPGLGANPATVTQVRTWVYNSNMQLDSVTHPESGTTTFAYNADGTLLRKTDQKGQKIENTYDSEGRVTAVRRYDAGGTEDACARVDYYYGTQSFAPSFTSNATGRLAAVATGVQTGMCIGVGAGQLIEMYSYTVAGAVTKKRLRIIRSAGTVDKDVTYTYGTDGKLATILYPGANTPYTYTYDLLDRPTKMTGPADYLATSAVDIAKDVVYGVAGNVTSMKYLQYENSGSFIYYTETKSYNSLFQLTRQTTTGTGGGADIEYSFSASANNGRITGRKNYVSGEDVRLL